MNILAWIFPLPKCQPGVYRITNRKNGRYYIGTTTRPMVDRWREHRDDLSRGKHHNTKLQQDWHYYRASAFRFSVIEVVPDISQVFAREHHWQVTEYNAALCYNPPPGWKPTPPNRKPVSLVDYDAAETQLILRRGYWVLRTGGMELSRINDLFANVPEWLRVRLENEYDPDAPDMVEEQRQRNERMRRRGNRRK